MLTSSWGLFLCAIARREGEEGDPYFIALPLRHQLYVSIVQVYIKSSPGIAEVLSQVGC